jgi:hypothetical protein
MVIAVFGMRERQSTVQTWLDDRHDEFVWLDVTETDYTAVILTERGIETVQCSYPHKSQAELKSEAEKVGRLPWRRIPRGEQERYTTISMPVSHPDASSSVFTKRWWRKVFKP